MSFRSKKFKKELIEKEVTINIGMINHNSYGDTYKVRGKILPLKVGMHSSAEDILKLAMQKRKNYDRSFRSDQNYYLAYPDGRKVESIPGSTEKFTLSKYKEDLGKQYSRITLYIANAQEQIISISDSEEDSLPSINCNVKTKLENISFIKTKNAPAEIDNSPCTSKEAEVNSPHRPEIRCPICNKSFTMDVIENHANACLNEKETPFTCYGEYNCEENECIINDQVIEITNSISSTASQNEITIQVRKAIAEVSCQEDSININIRRNFSFHDFHAYFQKP